MPCRNQSFDFALQVNWLVFIWNTKLDEMVQCDFSVIKSILSFYSFQYEIKTSTHVLVPRKFRKVFELQFLRIILELPVKVLTLYWRCKILSDTVIYIFTSNIGTWLYFVRLTEKITKGWEFVFIVLLIYQKNIT